MLYEKYVKYNFKAGNAIGDDWIVDLVPFGFIEGRSNDLQYVRTKK